VPAAVPAGINTWIESEPGPEIKVLDLSVTVVNEGIARVPAVMLYTVGVLVVPVYETVALPAREL